MNVRAVRIKVADEDEVSGSLNIPDGYDGEAGIIIAHGAGNNLDHPLLAALANGLAEKGILTLRFNFLYRERGKESVDPPYLLYAAWQAAHRFLVSMPAYRPRKLIGAGKSLGGRMASQMAAEGLLKVDGLVFLGYPLHAPGRKDRLRAAHLSHVTVPMLFFAGTRDPLCDIDRLQSVLAGLSAPWELEVIEGGDHSLKVPEASGITQEEVFLRVIDKTVDWVRTLRRI